MHGHRWPQVRCNDDSLTVWPTAPQDLIFADGSCLENDQQANPTKDWLAGGYQKGDLVRSLIAFQKVQKGDVGTVDGPCVDTSKDKAHRVSVVFGGDKGKLNMLVKTQIQHECFRQHGCFRVGEFVSLVAPALGSPLACSNKSPSPGTRAMKGRSTCDAEALTPNNTPQPQEWMPPPGEVLVVSSRFHAGSSRGLVVCRPNDSSQQWLAAAADLAPAAVPSSAHRFKRGDVVQLNPAAAKAFGLKWENIGATKPSQGQELVHHRLHMALYKKTIFTQQEWEDFGIKGLCIDHFLKRGSDYFKPAVAAKCLGAPADNKRGVILFAGALRKGIQRNIEVACIQHQDGGDEGSIVAVSLYSSLEIQLATRCTYTGAPSKLEAPALVESLSELCKAADMQLDAERLVDMFGLDVWERVWRVFAGSGAYLPAFQAFCKFHESRCLPLGEPYQGLLERRRRFQRISSHALAYAVESCGGEDEQERLSCAASWACSTCYAVNPARCWTCRLCASPMPSFKCRVCLQTQPIINDACKHCYLQPKPSSSPSSLPSSEASFTHECALHGSDDAVGGLTSGFCFMDFARVDAGRMSSCASLATGVVFGCRIQIKSDHELAGRSLAGKSGRVLAVATLSEEKEDPQVPRAKEDRQVGVPPQVTTGPEVPPQISLAPGPSKAPFDFSLNAASAPASGGLRGGAPLGGDSCGSGVATFGSTAPATSGAGGSSESGVPGRKITKARRSVTTKTRTKSGMPI